jgi:hypothetical protein
MKTYWTNFGVKGLLLGSLLWAQSVGIGTSSPDASARLEVSSTNQGVLIPRVSLTSVTDATTIPNPATSLLVYNTNASLASRRRLLLQRRYLHAAPTLGLHQ